MSILHRPEGIWGAILLPVKNDKIDWIAFEEQVNILCDSNVHGIYTKGTAAECHNQTEDEFDKLSNIVASIAKKKNKQFQLGLSHTNPRICRERAKRLTSLNPNELRPFRRQMQMIFQDPFASLNPRMTVGETIAEPMVVHGITDKNGASEKSVEILKKVGLTADYASRYPHELSGGQRQRIGIARALAHEPNLIIADEAVSALDVSIQAQVVNLMMELQEEFGLSYLFISHDMAVIERVCHRVAVMYLGEIVELGTRGQVFENPKHPYTKKLMKAVPIADPKLRKKELNLMTDEIPSLVKPIGYEPEKIDLIKIEEGHFIKPYN